MDCRTTQLGHDAVLAPLELICPHPQVCIENYPYPQLLHHALTIDVQASTAIRSPGLANSWNMASR